MAYRHRSKKNTPKGLTTQAPVRMDVINKLVISGNLVPHKEAALKTKMSGVLDKFYVAVGDRVKPGAPIARLKRLPTPEELEKLKRDLRQAQRNLTMEEAGYRRARQLFEKKMLSTAAYEKAVKGWEEAGERLAAAQDALDIELKGHIAGAKETSNIITATIGGIVSELSCKEGSIVAPYSTYSEGKPIATISDMSTILFQGQVGEMEVAHLRKGMQFEISLNAIKDKRFTTTLTKVAPKANGNQENKRFQQENQGIKFDIEGQLTIKRADKRSIRAGYTATADVVLEQAKDVLAIPEKCLHQDTQEATEKKDDAFFVWIYEKGLQCVSSATIT
ncbi:MAG: efflux RND transporter periplasmic adaptor subunit [Bacteroidota bacterium]